MIDFDTYRTGQQNDVLVLQISGQLDTASSQFLIDCIQGHIEDGLHKFVLDCTNLTHISSFGLATLVRANTSLKDRDGLVALAGVPGLLAELLRLSHLAAISLE